MFRNVITEGAHERTVEKFGFYVSMRMIRDSELVIDPQHTANSIEELGYELLPVFGKDVIRRTVRVYPVFQESLSDICGGSFP